MGGPGEGHKEQAASDRRRVSGIIRAALMDNGATYLESYNRLGTSTARLADALTIKRSNAPRGAVDLLECEGAGALLPYRGRGCRPGFFACAAGALGVHVW